jgi:hypothetical protein
MLATRTSEQLVPAGEETIAKPGASTVTLLPPAALTASMVRRGRDPWWGEDQNSTLRPGYDDAAARLARTRAIFERKDRVPDEDVLDLGMSAIITTEADSDDASAPLEPYVRTERRSSTIMRDVAIFLTVLMTSCVVTLYVSLRLD